MKIQFTFLSGARTGQVESFDQPFVQVGRHPHCDLRFDPDRDLDVSSRHASIMLQGEMYVLRDLGSTNGTFVGGKRISGDHILAQGDLVQFGRQGPKVEVRVVRDSKPITAESAAPGAAAPKPAAAPRATVDRNAQQKHPPAGGGTTVRIKAEVARQTAHLRRTTVTLLALLVLLASAYVWQSMSAAKRITREREAMMHLVDSLSTAFDSMTVSVASLQGALDSAKGETDRLRTRIGLGGSTAELAELRDQLSIAQRRQRGLATAASLDATAINRSNANAIVLVLAEFNDGTVHSGSGFAVKSDQASTLVITNRHVVLGPDGSRPTRLGVVFNGSNQNFKAEIAALPSADVDAALLRVEVRGGADVVKGIVTADPVIQTGEPVAMIGFPLGFDMPMGGDWTRIGVSASLSTGIVSKTPPGLLVVIGYGAPGSSGSPIFNKNGEVVGIIFGAQRETEGKVLLGVPIALARELLAGQ